MAWVKRERRKESSKYVKPYIHSIVQFLLFLYLFIFFIVPITIIFTNKFNLRDWCIAKLQISTTDVKYAVALITSNPLAIGVWPFAFAFVANPHRVINFWALMFEICERHFRDFRVFFLIIFKAFSEKQSQIFTESSSLLSS